MKCKYCDHPQNDPLCLCNCHAASIPPGTLDFSGLPDYVQEAVGNLNWKYGPRKPGFVYQDGKGYEWHYDGQKWLGKKQEVR